MKVSCSICSYSVLNAADSHRNLSAHILNMSNQKEDVDDDDDWYHFSVVKVTKETWIFPAKVGKKATKYIHFFPG